MFNGNFPLALFVPLLIILRRHVHASGQYKRKLNGEIPLPCPHRSPTSFADYWETQRHLPKSHDGSHGSLLPVSTRSAGLRKEEPRGGGHQEFFLPCLSPLLQDSKSREMLASPPLELQSSPTAVTTGILGNNPGVR